MKHDNSTKGYNTSDLRSVRTAYLERYLVRHFSRVSYNKYIKWITVHINILLNFSDFEPSTTLKLFLNTKGVTLP